MLTLENRYFRISKETGLPIDKWKSMRPDTNDGIWKGRTYTDASDGGKYNIGFMTGWGVYGIDVDVKGGRPGIQSWEVIKHKYSVPDTYTVTTPSGGKHYYYLVPEDAGLRNTASKFFGEAVDSRGDAGMLVAPGSSKPSGTYLVTANIPMAQLPTELINDLKSHKDNFIAQWKSAGMSFDSSGNIPLGTITTTLCSIAGRLVEIMVYPTTQAIMSMINELYWGHCEEPTLSGWDKLHQSFPTSIQGWIDKRKQKDAVVVPGSETINMAAEAKIYTTQKREFTQYPTGLPFIDEACNGGPGADDLFLVASRMKQGKTSVLIDICYRWARSGYKIMFLEMEMSKNEITDKFMARHTGISTWLVRKQVEEARAAIEKDISEYSKITSNIDLVIEPTAKITVDSIKELVTRRENAVGHKFDIVIIDYVGLLTGEGDTYWEQALDVSTSLRAYTLSSHKLITAAIQLNRTTDGVDLFSSMAGGDGWGRTHTIVAFLNKEKQKVEAPKNKDGSDQKDKFGNTKMLETEEDEQSMVCTAGKVVEANNMKVTVMGRNVISSKSVNPFAFSVCSFTDVQFDGENLFEGEHNV